MLAGLKERLLAPELVEEFVRTYVAEVNAANRERGARQAGLAQQQAKVARQIRNLLDLMKEGRGSPALVGELQDLERRHAVLAAEIAAAGVAEPVPVLHPNLPELYRCNVKTLEQALADPATAAAAVGALRSLVDAVLVHPGQRRARSRSNCVATWPPSCIWATRRSEAFAETGRRQTAKRPDRERPFWCASRSIGNVGCGDTKPTIPLHHYGNLTGTISGDRLGSCHSTALAYPSARPVTLVICSGRLGADDPRLRRPVGLKLP